MMTDKIVVQGFDADTGLPKQVDLLSVDGKALVNETAISAGETITIDTAPGGKHQQITLNPGLYRIDSEIDSFIKPSADETLYQLDQSGGGFMRTPNGMGSFTGLNFGANDFGFEWFGSYPTDVSDNRLFTIGEPLGSSAAPRASVEGLFSVVGGVLRVVLRVRDNAGAVVLANRAFTQFINAYSPSDDLFHLFIQLRPASQQVRIYINGNLELVDNTAWDAAPTTFGFTSSVAQVRLGAARPAEPTTGNTSQRIALFAVHNGPIDDQQVAELASLGPARAFGLTSNDQFLVYYVSMSEFTEWSDPTIPEAKYLSSGAFITANAFSVQEGIQELNYRPNTDLATSRNSAMIHSGVPENVMVPADGTLNFHAPPYAQGLVRITKK